MKIGLRATMAMQSMVDVPALLILLRPWCEIKVEPGFVSRM